MQQNSHKRQSTWRDRNAAKRELTWSDRAASLRYIRPLFVLLWQTSPRLMVVTIVLRLCRAGLPLLALWIPKLIIDAIVQYASQGAGSKTRIWSLVALELTVAITNDILTRFNTLCDSLLADRFENRISVDVIRHASTLDLASFEDPSFHDSLERARNQNTNRMALIAALLNLIQDVVSLGVLSMGLLLFSPWLIVLLAGAAIPSFSSESRFNSLKYSSLYRWTPYRRLLDYLRYLGASIESAKEVKILGLGPHLAKIYTTVSTDIYEDNKRLAIRRATIGSALSIVSTGAYYTAYLVIITDTLASRLSLGTFTFLAASFARSRLYIDRIAGAITEISEQAIYLADLFGFFDARPSIQSLPNARMVPRPPKQGFEFRNVSFAYPGSDRSVLQNISFTLAPGETLALVGDNGAGKSTLVKLLSRLYDPTDGEILLDGIDLRNYDLKDLHNAIGILFQDYMHYDMLVRDNIGFGSIDCLDDMTQIAAAAEKSGAHELIGRLPKAYEQMLGRRFEGGISLSGGEWQKVALARAYMRDAQLMILDEPTSALDARAEYELFQHFTELAHGRMRVLISHRLSTVRMADRILVLKHGTIKEQGKHGDLVQLGQHYAELFELQASAYR
jgi:ATP-binding cassette subfamily B protein